ncbi:hypothetical protein BGW38_004151 [Lunasporangiospora selenospora]|uniref:RlpA-like protein double-psi beta-barrel domain-containing protein n=1 Tax=Lunasporangiospora selenospora TaxID=979761 RepID=A0A9P6FRP2_9FUNG|nr:hypothetical protein BGW38_004151 [Lunasporangiospora selenospora]
MAVFYKFALIATAALATIATAAPIDTTVTPSAIAAPEVIPAVISTPVRRNTSAKLMTSSSSDSDQVVSAASFGPSPYSGRGTWFTDNVGSCGIPFDTQDLIVAMNAAQQQGTAQCGRKVRVYHKGKAVIATVTDTCPSEYCNSGSLDLSQAVFQKLAPLDKGVIEIKWEYI